MLVGDAITAYVARVQLSTRRHLFVLAFYGPYVYVYETSVQYSPEALVHCFLICKLECFAHLLLAVFFGFKLSVRAGLLPLVAFLGSFSRCVTRAFQTPTSHVL